MPKPNLLTQNKLPCQEIKCNDFLVEDGPPAWCYLLGVPASAAMKKCPKLAEQKPSLELEIMKEKQSHA
jgi:hypothetical protein